MQEIKGGSISIFLSIPAQIQNLHLAVFFFALDLCSLNPICALFFQICALLYWICALFVSGLCSVRG